jgi:hypothetical protein
MTSPFGIPLYSPLNSLNSLAEIQFGIHTVHPPSPHPLFSTYIVRSTPGLGVVWIKAIGPDIENDAFGHATIAVVDRVKDQVALRYGAPEKTDMLLPGSTWEEPQYWMSGLASNERIYSYTWKRPATPSLPEDLESVYVGAMPREFGVAAAIIEYASPKLQLADAEDDREMSNLL